jgi:hypothetical protein
VEEVMSEMTQRVADAIQQADEDCSFNMKLIRLVDGVSTYSLRYSDGMYLEFEDQDELYEHIRQRKAQYRARAAIAAVREVSEPMKHIGGRIVANLSSGRAIEPYEDDAVNAYQAMIDTALGGTDAA